MTLRTALIGVVLLLIAAGWWLATHAQADSCLDAGGRWHEASESCERAELTSARHAYRRV